MVAAPSAGRGRVLLLRAFLGAMIAAVAYVGVQSFLQRPVEIPESVGGVSRLHDALARNFAEQMRTDAERFDPDKVQVKIDRHEQVSTLAVDIEFPHAAA